MVSHLRANKPGHHKIFHSESLTLATGREFFPGQRASTRGNRNLSVLNERIKYAMPYLNNNDSQQSFEESPHGDVKKTLGHSIIARRLTAPRTVNADFSALSKKLCLILNPLEQTLLSIRPVHLQ